MHIALFFQVCYNCGGDRMKIAYYYQGNKEYIEKLKKYDLTLLIDDENYIDELVDYGLNVRVVKYDTNNYDILVAETDNIKGIFAYKKVVIGTFQVHKNKILYLDSFDEKRVLEAQKRDDIKFSIVIPNYNNGEWIGKTIESVLNQTHKEWEMYIIDDMSTDNSVEVIKSYQDERITLIENKIKLYNGGSRNVGILKAKESNPYGYLLFIDSDDWLANDKVLETLNHFIDEEDLITLDYQYYMNGKIQGSGIHSYKDKNDLFMTYGAMCAVWCKCFKVSIAPLFEFNTLMEDRNYHYRLINRIKTYSNLGKITHTWNKMNYKSITSNKSQKYNGDLQAKLEWNNCAYRHIAGMLDLLNEVADPVWKDFIKQRIESCKSKIRSGVYEQY